MSVNIINSSTQSKYSKTFPEDFDISLKRNIEKKNNKQVNKLSNNYTKL